MNRSLILAIACALASAGAVQAQSLRDLCPDRPGKGTPPCILDAGHVQIEVGAIDLQDQRAAGQSVMTVAYAATEARLGLTRAVEVEAAWTPWTQVRTKSGGAETRLAGAGDVTLSLRAGWLNPEGGDGPAAALEPFVTAPTGAVGIGVGRWQFGLIAPASLPLGRGFTLALTPQAAAVANQGGGGRHLALIGVVGVSHSLGPISASVELWGDVDENTDGRATRASLDLTAAYAPKAAPYLQLDAGVDLGLNRNTPDVEVAVGIARRF